MGETLAVRYLKSKGFSILAKNFNIPGVGEIDIIAHCDGTFHFVEVKSSYSFSLNSEYHSSRNFDDAKKQRIARVMRKYCDLYKIDSPRTVSLCVISFSRETYDARVFFDPFVLVDTI